MNHLGLHTRFHNYKQLTMKAVIFFILINLYTLVLHAGDEVYAQIEANRSSGFFPLRAQFICVQNRSDVTYFGDFGNGTTSTEQNP